ncbi:hypothetical protein NE865_16628 [Phthorimaea operculella]|nr:hypothetical protein NE865_16628 [Phthorimaea operculella]
MFQVNWKDTFDNNLYTFHLILQLFLPAYMAHKAKTEINLIKLLLHEQLSQLTEDNPDILRLLLYMDTRRLDHKLWGFIPVDLRLPIALFNLCTSSFIVIIQVTHVLE